jgi:hypothetical protein
MVNSKLEVDSAYCDDLARMEMGLVVVGEIWEDPFLDSEGKQICFSEP